MLAVKDYELRVDSPGFSVSSTRTAINSGSVREVKAVLEASTNKQKIVIEASGVAINTTISQLQSSVEAKAITQLSLPNGVLSLAGTTPGVVPVTARNPILEQCSYNSNSGRGRASRVFQER